QIMRDTDGFYAPAAAAGLGLTVRAAPPGVGSDLWVVSSLPLMMVNTDTYASVYTYMKREFGADFDATDGKFDKGYMDYNKLRAAPAKPAFDASHYLFIRDKTKTKSGLRFTTATQPPTHAGTDVKLKEKRVVGLISAGVGGHLYVLVDTDAAKSEGFYVQDDGKLVQMKKNAAGGVHHKDKEIRWKPGPSGCRRGGVQPSSA